MNREGHTIVGWIALTLLFIYNIVSLPTSTLLLFSMFFIFFTAKINPDIDLALPLLSHRGGTHSPILIIIFSAIVILALPYISIEQSFLNIIVIIVMAFSCAWLLHIVTDWVYDRIRSTTWFLILLGIMLLYIRLR